jgi:long-chain fatty acid transport protein
MLKKITVSFFIVSLSAALVFGSGFSIYEQGGKATAMAGAFIAQANDATAVFYNPAGITSLQGFNLNVGLTVIKPSASFQGPTAPGYDPNLYSEAEDLTFYPPTFYATYQINEDLSAGFGFFVPYGLGSDWGKEWIGRELATFSEVQTMYLNPVIAYKVMDNLSVAAGFDFVFGSVHLEKSLYLGYTLDEYAEFKLEGNTTGMGFNLGLQYKPLENLSLGLVFRSNVTLSFDDGEATFEIPSINPGIDPVLRQNLPNTKGKAELVLPTHIGLGIAYDFTEQLTAEFDYLQIGWSSYDELVIEFEDPVNGETEQTVPKNYENSASYRFGIEYRLNEKLALRAGYLRDTHAVPDDYVEPTLPEGDRNIYNIGVGYKISGFTIDAFYMALLQEDREITNSKNETIEFNGTYKSVANLFGLSVGYSF